MAGSPDPLYGEQVVAYVVTHESWTSLLEESLRLHCAQYLSPHKVPSVFIPVDALPRTYTGKLDRQALRQKQLDHVTEKVGIHAA